MLEHLISWPRTAAEPPHPCIVLLHGRGSNEQDLFGLVPELPRRPAVVSLRAPLAFPWGGFAWYELSDQSAKPDQRTLDGSLAQLTSFVGELPAKYDVDPTRVYVLGFSQGALMANCLLLTQPSKVAAAAILSGYLPLQNSLDVNRAGLTGKRVFQAHGSDDDVLPITLGRQGRVHLEGLGVDVEWHEYQMAHQVIEDELRDLRAWFKRQELE